MIYRVCNTLTTSKWFKFCSLTAIILNSITLGMSAHGNSKEFEEMLDYFNLGFFSFFLFELMAKLLG